MSNQFRVKVFFDGKGKCHWCGRRVRLVKAKFLPDDAATIDHLHERNGMGMRESHDVVLACHKCNHDRGIKHNEELLAKYGRVIYRADE